MAEKETITKEKLAEELKNQLGLSHLVCEEIINNFFEEIVEVTKKDSKLTFKNFGKFFVNHKKARPGLNIKTGEVVEVPERTVLRFTASRTLKEKL